MKSYQNFGKFPIYIDRKIILLLTFFLFCYLGSYAQPPMITITGTVVDENNQPLAGATVIYIKGKLETTVATNEAGAYTINVAKDEGGRIEVSYQGKKTQSINIKNQTSIQVKLKTESTALEEVVVSTGYQKVDRKLFSGSSVNLSMKDAKIEGITDASKLLEGRVAGVSLQSPSATFGAAPKIRIRGTTSISGNGTPLFVMDGVILENLIEISTDDLSSGNANTILSSAIAGLNPEDISSFQVLKDASATSIYGARAKNGVIVITTKSGKFNQRASISYSGSFTLRQKPSYAQYNIMNSSDQMNVLLDMYRKGLLSFSEVFSAENSGVFGIMYDKLSTIDPTTGKFLLENTESAKNAFLQKYASANTDWFDLLFKSSIMQTHSVSLSAGGENSSFYSSVSYLTDPGQTISDNVNRLTLTLKETIRFKEKVTIGLQFNGSIRNQLSPTSENSESQVVYGGPKRRTFDINPYLFAINTSRTLRAYDENGNYEYSKKNYAPFNILKETQNNYTNLNALDFLAQFNFGYTFAPGLKYELTTSVRYNTSVSKQTITENSNYANAYRANSTQQINEDNKLLFHDISTATAPGLVVLPVGGFYRQLTNDIANFYIRNTLNWGKKISTQHEFNVFAGQEIRYIDRTYAYFSAPAVQYDNGLVTKNFDPQFYLREKQLGNEVLSLVSLSTIPRERTLAYFLNLAYNYDQRFTINLTGRYDGSNRLGKSANARWLPTWNVSASWNVSNESFWEKLPKLRDIVSQLKLRMTYGLTASTGSTNNGTPVFLSKYNFRTDPDARENSIDIDKLGDAGLTWEKQYEYNVGLDVGLLKDRIYMVWDMYFRRGFDVIGEIYTTGIGGEYLKEGNYANTRSNGTELSIAFYDIINRYVKKVDWNVNVIFSYNESEIVQLKAKPQISDLTAPTGGNIEGRPINSLYSIVFKGLDKNGIPTFTNEKGNLTDKDNTVYFQSRTTDYLKYEGPVTPTVTGGINNTFRYGGFELNVFFSYQFGNKVRIPWFNISDDIASSTTQWKNRWSLPGDELITTQPAIASSRMNQLYSKNSIKQLYGAYAISDQTVADGGFLRLKSISLSYNFPKAWISNVFQNLSLRFGATNLALFFTDTKLEGLDPEFANAGGVALPIQTQYTLSINATF